jgi:CubicO group peptidase (beta-lactamase class C family)
MQVIKENKLLFIWWTIAFATAFYAFGKKNNTRDAIKQSVGKNFFSFPERAKTEIDSLFYYKSRQGFNGVVLVGQKDSVFYSKTFGYANFKNRDSLTLHSAFQLASVSKQFTAVAIMQLHCKGMLNYTDSIQKFFPDFPYKGITIQQLLTHRSGLPNYIYFYQYIPTTYDTIISNTDLVNEMITKYPAEYYPPNRCYQYSNTGYALLAAIVEKVTGVSFFDYLRKNIFDKLKMTETFTYRDIISGKRKCNTTGYLYRCHQAESNYLDGVLGDKGVYSSVTDLFKWDQGLYKNIVINFDTLQRAFLPMGKPMHFKSNYGYGWRMYYLQDSTKILFHAGWWHGYKTLLIRVQKDSTTVVVLKNRSKGVSINSKKILEILYPCGFIKDTVIKFTEKRQ